MLLIINFLPLTFSFSLLPFLSEEVAPFVEVAGIFETYTLLVGHLESGVVVGVATVEYEHVEPGVELVSHQHVAHDVVGKRLAGRQLSVVTAVTQG